MGGYELEYQQALAAVENSITQALAGAELPPAEELALVHIESNLDAWDYCYAIAIGMVGVFIATNDEFEGYLAGIHKVANEQHGSYDLFQSFVGNLLHHKGDHMDKVCNAFITRDGTNAYGLFHRLLWGHDVFSVKCDNPFALMYRQKGIAGILQVVRHLIADTASTQGLPLPGSSFFDTKRDNGGTTNYLISLAQNIANEVRGDAQVIYSHMMTIRAQDITAGTVVKLVTELYFRLRDVSDEIRKAEIRLIAYSVNFFGEAVAGMTGEIGVPYINVPLATVLATSFARFCYLNERDIYRLSKETDRLHESVVALEASAAKCEDAIPEFNTAEELIHAADTAEDNMTKLLGFLGEGLR